MAFRLKGRKKDDGCRSLSRSKLSSPRQYLFRRSSAFRNTGASAESYLF
ncbi:hypothetical protein [uncultured Chryseobacterium sp.]|nr:hypothetical protein [uncultured Chryseobacterium sp.]